MIGFRSPCECGRCLWFEVDLEERVEAGDVPYIEDLLELVRTGRARDVSLVECMSCGSLSAVCDMKVSF